MTSLIIWGHSSTLDATRMQPILAVNTSNRFNDFLMYLENDQLDLKNKRHTGEYITCGNIDVALIEQLQ